MLECATCDDALRILREEGLYEKTLARLMERISAQLNRRTGGEPPVEAIIFSNVYGILAETENAGSLKQRITGEY